MTRVFTIDLDDPHLPPLRAWLKILKDLRIEHEVECFKGSHKRAARALGVTRSTVWRSMHRTGK